MDVHAAMKALEEAGSAGHCRTLQKQGVKPPMCGVPAGTMKGLAKSIGTDQALARRLWETRHHDARVLATLIADARQTDAWLIDRWRHDVTNAVLCEALAALGDAVGVSADHIDRWCAAGDEWTSTLGWSLVARRLSRPGGWSDADLARKVTTIERGIQRAPSRTRGAMHVTLLALALRSDDLRRAVMDAAQRIGPVQVDAGDGGPMMLDTRQVLRDALASASEKDTSRGKTPRAAASAASAASRARGPASRSGDAATTRAGPGRKAPRRKS